MCQSPSAPKNRLIGELGYDRNETAVLTVIRYFFQSFQHPASQSWVNAFGAAEARFAQPLAGEVTARALHMVMCMRTSRKSSFCFTNPNCTRCAARVTSNEAQFMSVLKLARHHRPEAMQAHASLLCEGNDVTAYLNAVWDVVAALDGAATDPALGRTAQMALDPNRSIPPHAGPLGPHTF